MCGVRKAAMKYTGPKGGSFMRMPSNMASQKIGSYTAVRLREVLGEDVRQIFVATTTKTCRRRSSRRRRTCCRNVRNMAIKVFMIQKILLRVLPEEKTHTPEGPVYSASDA